MKQPNLFDLDGGPSAETPPVPDQAARDFAVDPRNDVVLEASAGTGKTRVLVDRYVRLLEAGVDPRHILAITFTRKAAAEMRERVIAELHRRAAAGAWTPAAWRALQNHLADIQISTIDAFCFALLHEFPLEGDVEPGFEIADETEIARFANEAMDLTFRAIRGRLETDEPLRLLLARIKLPVLRGAVAALLDRRHVACPAVATFVRRQGPARTTDEIAAAFVARIRDLIPAGATRSALLDDGPSQSPEFRWLRADLSRIDQLVEAGPARAQHFRRRLERYFLTKAGEPRKKLGGAFKADLFASADARRRHEAGVRAVSGGVKNAIDALDAQIDVLLARGVETLLATAADRYERLLEEHGLLDFAAMLQKSVALLERQEEFARSRMKLQSRYHHVLVDEFQDTSRLQWRLVELLIDAWGEGEGATDAPTSVFVVGDRKQSIYRFRHAEVTLLDEAARKIAALRPGRGARQVITTSFRAVPELLAFVNAVSQSMAADRDEAAAAAEATAPGDRETTRVTGRFSYGDADRFPVPEIAPGALRDGEPVLGAIAAASLSGCAAAVASEVERLLRDATVRDRHGPPRAARPDDIAILFRARQGHPAFEDALEARGIRTYVYKGLGFFDAPEVQDLQALLRYLAEPDSDLRAAELLRSRFVRLSDVALVRLAPAFAQALGAESPADRHLDEPDRGLLVRARASLASWLPLADRISPSELVDRIMRESAYLHELRGRRLDQARENVKKVRALIRRVESRGYATLGRLADYFETLRAGDESNAIVEASGCVNLMTVHAAKGLEFPIVFLVNLHIPGRGASAGFTVIEHSLDGEPEVAFRSSPGLDLEEQREEEELRRLVYVALTRARDRLYLATELDPRGRVPRKARSLAGLLPVGLTDALAAAATATPTVTWTSPAGDFTFRVCLGAEPGPALPAIEAPEPPVFDLTPISPAQPGPIAATAASAGPAPADSRPDFGAAADRLAGTLVHRLLPRALPPDADERTVADAMTALIRSGDLVDVADPAAVVAAAVAAYGRLRRHPDVVAALAAGTCHFEVPFSYARPGGDGTIVRGVIDCLVVAPDGGVTVLEFKTGRPRPEHDAQAETYLAALRAAFGTDRVEIKIIYP